MRLTRIPALALFLVVLVSCQALRDFVHDDDVVARVGTHRMYLSDLREMLPSGLSPEDSVHMADQFIRSWASEQLYLDMATEQLSKEEMDVTKELETYRSSLLRYRYEQRYVNERLDTTVSHTEIEQYYNDHKDIFMLDVPILKGRFVDIMEDSPNYDVIRRKMSSVKYEDIAETDSLAYSSALRFLDFSDTWTDAVTLAREFGMDYGTMLSRKKDSYIEVHEERGDAKIAYILDILKEGSLAPIEYCEERIRDIIISNRKHRLLSTLEQDLLEDALAKEKLVIYSEK